MTEEFETVLDLACKYLEAKRKREEWERFNEREDLRGKLGEVLEPAKADEVRRQRAFVEAYKEAEERPRPQAK